MPRTYEIESSHMLKNIRNFRHNENMDFEPVSILLKFYPDKTLAAKDIHRNSDYLYHNVTRLAKQNYLEKIDKNHVAARYKITLRGKCRILCCKFGTSFLCLCILAEAYSIYKHQITNRCRDIYTLYDIEDTFAGIFTEKSVRNAGSRLCTRGLVYRISNNMIRIEKNTLKKLDEYDKDMNELHEWIISVPNQLNQLLIEDPDALNKIKYLNRK